ncbi:hypothetical protein, partial [Pseudomonas viridiflava]|uniref:hypothetical protein n=1 Tax=Pseudomonas viridiflava TaxID=33069 RepID=UPI001980ACD1
MNLNSPSLDLSEALSMTYCSKTDMWPYDDHNEGLAGTQERRGLERRRYHLRSVIEGRNDSKDGHEKGRPKSPFLMVKQNSVLFFHLRTQQVTNSGRTSA